MASGVTWTNTMADNDYDSALNKAVESALTVAGIILERDAVARTPVDTGRLRGSLTWKTRDHSGQGMTDAESVSRPNRSWVLHVGTNVEYAPHIEYGTVRMKAQPFLRPALNHRKNDILRDFGKWVEKCLKRGK